MVMQQRAEARGRVNAAGPEKVRARTTDSVTGVPAQASCNIRFYSMAAIQQPEATIAVASHSAKARPCASAYNMCEDDDEEDEDELLAWYGGKLDVEAAAVTNNVMGKGKGGDGKDYVKDKAGDDNHAARNFGGGGKDYVKGKAAGDDGKNYAKGKAAGGDGNYEAGNFGVDRAGCFAAGPSGLTGWGQHVLVDLESNPHAALCLVGLRPTWVTAQAMAKVEAAT